MAVQALGRLRISKGSLRQKRLSSKQSAFAAPWPVGLSRAMKADMAFAEELKNQYRMSRDISPPGIALPAAQRTRAQRRYHIRSSILAQLAPQTKRTSRPILGVHCGESPCEKSHFSRANGTAPHLLHSHTSSSGTVP